MTVAGVTATMETVQAATVKVTAERARARRTVGGPTAGDGTVGGRTQRSGGRPRTPGDRGAFRGVASADVPVPVAATRLLARSDAELVAAQLATSEDERFVHAHLAALRAGAALLAVVGRPVRRRNPRSVWDLVALAEPELAVRTAFFADGAATRSAIEAGRDGGVDSERAEATVVAAEDFQDAVRRRIGSRDDGATLELRAS